PAGKFNQIAILARPIDPRNFVVLAIGVVVTALSSSQFVTGEDHGGALRQHQAYQYVALLTGAQRIDCGVLGRPLNSAIPRSIVTLAIAILFAVRLVVFLAERHQIMEGESVMRCYEIDAGTRPPARPFEDIGAAGEARSELAKRLIRAAP